MNDLPSPTRGLTVAICEDDVRIVRLLQETFDEEGHTTRHAATSAEAIARFSDADDIDVIVLDIGLPDGDGRDTCRALRANGQTAPVLFLTALGRVHDIVSGFASGGLDYVVKPFAIPELLARVEAITRRAGPTVKPGGLLLDPSRFTLRHGPIEQTLTPTEFRLLAELLVRTGGVVRRPELVAAGWTPGARVGASTLDTYLHRLRRHLTAVGSTAHIETVRGVGYALRQ